MRTLQITVRLSDQVVEKLDTMAGAAGLTRAQLMRMLLSRASAEDLPAGLVENAACLRDARGVAR
jgi:predicted transcriptional regulator